MTTLTTKPRPGQLVRVIVHSELKSRLRRLINKMFNGLDYQSEEYFGEVKDLPHLPVNQFALSTGNVNFPIRVITVDQIKSIYIDGERCKFNIEVGTRTVNVESSRPGAFYNVTVVDGKPTKCTCPGFGYRRDCRHLKLAALND